MVDGQTNYSVVTEWKTKLTVVWGKKSVDSLLIQLYILYIQVSGNSMNVVESKNFV